MTNEEMAAELRKAGWRVQEPITQATCRHRNMRGSAGVSGDGSGYSKSYCPECGYKSEHNWPPRHDIVLPMNLTRS